mgnify:CR=1 FL=1
MLYLILAIVSSSMLCRWNVKGVSGASRSSKRITFAEVGYGMAYPTFSVATIGVISLAGIFLFREQFTKKQVSAMCIIAVALVLLN